VLTFRWISAAGGQYPLFVPKPEDANKVAQWEALAAKHGVSLPAVAIAFGAVQNLLCFTAFVPSLAVLANRRFQQDSVIVRLETETVFPCRCTASLCLEGCDGCAKH
jgi:hypothetical protein